MIFYKILYSLCEFVKKRIQVKFKEIFFYIKFNYKNILKYKKSVPNIKIYGKIKYNNAKIAINFIKPNKNVKILHATKIDKNLIN